MGQAHTVMAMETLAVPDWFELRTAVQAQWWLRTLEEHDTVLRRLIDSHSEEIALLKQYRRTFQSRWQDSVAEFVEFLAGYGALLFKRRAQDHWELPQLTIAGVTPILRRDPKLRRVVRDPGFLAVAAAVRAATLGSQAARHNGRPDHREIRYGLLSDIRRAGQLGTSELLSTIQSFISSFNRETVKRNATGLGAAHIKQGEMEAFANALKFVPSSVKAGSLLGGFATCLRTDSSVVEVGVEVAQAVPA
jgi:hypothetical protein